MSSTRNRHNKVNRPESELWREYKAGGSIAARDRLVDNYMFLVEKIALRLKPNLPKHITIEDLFSYGIVGLLEAIDNFNPDAGVKFETFATWRVKGEILDFLRREDFLPKGVRSKIKRVQDKLLEIEAVKGIMHICEAARHLNMAEAELQQMIFLSNSANILSLDMDGDEQDGQLLNVLEGKGMSPSEILDRRLAVEEIKNLLEGLEGREKKILYMHYIEGMAFKEIAQVLGLSEGRVSQMHSNIIFFLRTALIKRGITCPSGL